MLPPASVINEEKKKPIDASDVNTPRGESAKEEVKRLRKLIAEMKDGKSIQEEAEEEAPAAAAAEPPAAAAAEPPAAAAAAESAPGAEETPAAAEEPAVRLPSRAESHVLAQTLPLLASPATATLH